MLARRFLYIIAGLIMLTLGAAIGWNLFQDRLMRFAFVPPTAFAAPAGAVDYADPANWVARPGKADDPSRYLPAGAAPGTPRVAVFFVPPTTYFGRAAWNAPLNDAAANDRLVTIVKGQASAFTGSGEVWAPRYRQATIGAFLTGRADAERALAFAYGDVEHAFDAFLAAIPPDRPILLAGHSQGSLHLMTLLARRIAGTPIARRIVAAYVVGWPVSIEADLPKLGLPACQRAGQSGCILSWQSFADPADPKIVVDAYQRTAGLTGAPRRGTRMLCTNPLTGAPDTAAPESANRGALVPSADLKSAVLKPGLVPAACLPSGFLGIGAPPPGYTAYVLPGNNYHVFDYALFWANVRADADARVAAFLRDRAAVHRP